MALAIATNNAALRAAASASSVNRDMETSMARLSSGKRINSASDDAAGVAISSRLTSNIRGTDQAIRNALDGQALIDTAEGAHKEIENILQRMREIAVQAANDTNNAQDRDNLQAEMDALSEEINRIAGTTTWAGTKMLDAENSDFSFHIGAGVSEQDQVKVSIGSMTSSALGLGGSTSSSSSSSSSGSGSGSGEASLTFTSGVNDTFDVSNGAEETNISAGLQAHLDSLSATVVGFDDPSTNRTSAASFNLSSITETITSAVLTIRAKPLDNERAEGNDTIILSGFDTNGTALMPQYTVGLGLDAGPNNYFDFDWQIDGRPAVPNEGFEITIDLSNFAAQQGTSLNLLDDINTEKLLDIIIADDTLVDFVELTVSFPSTSSSASGGSITTPQRVGSEFQVNTYTAGEQTKTNIASLSGGGFVGTWMSNGQDGSGEGVYGQIYDASGNAVGSEFLINSETNNNQDHPSVTGLSDGGFVVAWESTGQDGSGDGVYGQRYDASAAAIGVEFKINTHTSNEQRDIHLASLEGGGFVANWISYNQDGNIWGIYGQRFDSSGNAAGAEFRINTHTANNQQSAQITSLPDGGFLAMFGSDSSTHAQPDTSFFGAYGQRYDASGNPVGAEFRINTYTSNHQGPATATGLTDGGFVISWSSYGQDEASSWGIYGQRYDASGTAVGSEFKVNTNNSNDQHYSSITSLDDGGFLVVWQSSEQDGSGTGIYGQRYASNGETVGSEFVINSTTNNDQARASVTSVSDGNIVVAWSSAGQDGDGNGIFAQIFDTGASSSSGSSSSSSSSSTESSNSSDSSSSSSSGPTLDSPSNAMAAITAIDNAIKTVNIQRSKLGAVSNRLSHTVNNLTNISSNLSAAQGGIEDADFAKETTDLAKNQILQQASTAMLAQANASKQNVLSLLQG